MRLINSPLVEPLFSFDGSFSYGDIKHEMEHVMGHGFPFAEHIQICEFLDKMLSCMYCKLSYKVVVHYFLVVFHNNNKFVVHGTSHFDIENLKKTKNGVNVMWRNYNGIVGAFT